MTESNNPSAIRSKNEITEALLSLMQNAPYNEISVKQIIMEARLARKTFYRNFESKDDVLISYLKGIIREYYNVVNTGKVNVLETIFPLILIVCVTASLLCGLHYLMPEMSLWRFLLTGLIDVVLVLGLAYLVLLNQGERNFALNTIRSKIHR